MVVQLLKSIVKGISLKLFVFAIATISFDPVVSECACRHEQLGNLILRPETVSLRRGNFIFWGSGE